MTTRGRPPIGPVFELRLPDDLRAWLDDRASDEGVPVAAMIRLLLRDAMDNERS